MDCIEVNNVFRSGDDNVGIVVVMNELCTHSWQSLSSIVNESFQYFQQLYSEVFTVFEVVNLAQVPLPSISDVALLVKMDREQLYLVKLRDRKRAL